MHASNYFRNVPCSLPTALGEAVLGKNQAGQMQRPQAPAGQWPWGAVALSRQHRLPIPGHARKREAAAHRSRTVTVTRCGLLMLSAAMSALAINKRRTGRSSSCHLSVPGIRDASTTGELPYEHTHTHASYYPLLFSFFLYSNIAGGISINRSVLHHTEHQLISLGFWSSCVSYTGCSEQF